MSQELEDLEDAIVASATEGIGSVSADGMTVTEQSLDSRVRALHSLRGEEAAVKPHFGLRFTQLVPPGTG